MAGYKKWVGELPKKCDLCGDLITSEHFIDGMVIAGSSSGWGILDEACHARVGTGLGTGRGQKYRMSDGVKVEG